jgi:tetratricopeptide (TPR) repeat protein
MGFWKTFFGGEEEHPEEQKKEADAKNFDLLKYDGVKATRIGQLDYAIKCFREALKLREDPETRDYLQSTLVHAGRLDEALTELQTMVALAPGNMAVLLQAAHVAFMQEDYDAMTTFCEQALAADADNATASFMMARALLGKGDLVGGIARLTKAIAQDEQLGDARLLRAQVLMRMGDTAGAQEDADWLLTHTEGQEDVLLLAARLQHAKGQDDDAIATYGQVIDLNPFHIDAYRERGQIRFDRGDKKGAEEDMQKVLELDPQALNGISGDYEAEGIEQKVKQAYTFLNPFGI